MLPDPRLRSAFSFLLAVDPVLVVELVLFVMWWTGACIEVGVPVSAVFRTHMASIMSSSSVQIYMEESARDERKRESATVILIIQSE